MSRPISFKRALVIFMLVAATPSIGMGRGGGGAGGGRGGGGGGGFGGGGGNFGGGRVVGHGPGFGPGFRGYRGPYWGGYHGYRGGWGYPLYGYGLGLGMGLGLGYGLSSGYGYSYGYPGPVYAYPTYVYGNGVYSNVTYYDASPAATPVPTPATNPVVPTSATMTDEAGSARSTELIHRGEAEFKKGNYSGATYSWRHAIVDDPQNPVVVMELGLALFAIGKFDEAAGATQAAMRALPKEHWGTVISHYRELYGNHQDYTRQLRSLEKAILAKPHDPALRFLAGFHFGYLGFLPQSIEQLEFAIQSEPRDEMAKQLLNEMKSRRDQNQSLPPASNPVRETSWMKSR